MNIDRLLILGVIGLPFLGVLLQWRWGNMNVRAQRWATAITLGVTGFVALTYLLISNQYACVFLGGRENCAFDGLSSLSAGLLAVVLAFVSALRESNEPYDYSFMLLLSSTWAGLVLTVDFNWGLSILSLTLLLMVVSRWTRARGGQVSFFFSRHEYNPDYPDYQDDGWPG
jgi:hypothetical protein